MEQIETGVAYPAPDPDGDGVPNRYQGLDTDRDGVSDWDEITVYGTDPYAAPPPAPVDNGSTGGGVTPALDCNGGKELTDEFGRKTGFGAPIAHEAERPYGN